MTDRPTAVDRAVEAFVAGYEACPTFGDKVGVERFDNCCVRAGLDAARHMDVRPDLGPVHLPWAYWDGTVETEIRATAYPYGGGQPGTGVQLTLESRHNGVTVAIRLPHDSAHRLAKAILAGEERRDSAPCAAETRSWDHFTPDQVDSYWIRCTVAGRHDAHKDGNTGLVWTDPTPPNADS